MILHRYASSLASSRLSPTIKQLASGKLGQGAQLNSRVTVSGWIKSIRKQKNVSFAVITDGSTASGLQAVLLKGKDEDLLKRLTNGAAVQLTGELVASPGAGQTHELLIDEKRDGKIVVLGECAPEAYPIQKKTLSVEYLRDNAHLRARTSHIAATMRLRNTLTRRINDWFETQGFSYAHTPVITGSDAEGAGEAFRLAPIQVEHPAASPETPLSPPPVFEFFSRPAYLTVSHQLHLEALATALSRVYTLSPCFRAEPSQTGRHLAEFWMLEAEWAFPTPEGVNGVCDFTEALLRDTTKDILQSDDMNLLWKEAHQGKRQALEKAMTSTQPWTKITYTEAIRELEKASSPSNTESRVNFVYTPKWGHTLQSEHERWLAESLVGGPVFVTDYPSTLKPFYMRSNPDDRTVACFDLLIPHVGELIGGSVREERVSILEQKMREARLLSPLDSDREGGYDWYLDLRKYGGAPHAGFGMGFERLLSWVGGIDNIRECIAMPRWAGRMLL